MSTAPPSSEKRTSDFMVGLIDDQQSLTAVERFSVRHESGELDSTALATPLSETDPAQAKYYRDLLPASPPSPDQQYAFEVDLDQCSGCKACVVACHTMNGLEEDEAWRRVGTLTIGEYNEPKSESESSGESAYPLAIETDSRGDGYLALPTIQHVTTACHHCEDPGCLNGCPVKAYEKDPETGIVRHLDDQCIGCKYCTMMCPYEVPQYSDRLGIVRKCDMCHQRLSVGEAPACVQACPNEAIAITLVNRGQSFVNDERIAPGAPLSSITQPTTQYVGRDVATNAASRFVAKPQDEGIDEVAESHWPLAALLIATQVSVGMIVAERVLSTIYLVVGMSPDESLIRWNALVALVVAGVGMNVAPLHLGQPLRAWRVFLGLRTSWLSREAVILGKYVGVLGIATTLLWIPVVEPWIPESIRSLMADWVPAWAAKAALGTTIPIGLAGLYSSAMIYIATRRRLWRFDRTMIRFMGTAAIAGLASVAAVSAATGHARLGMLLAVVTLIGTVGKLVYEWQILLGAIPTGDHFDKRSQRLVQRSLHRLSQMRLLAAVAGCAALLVGGVIALSFPTLGTIGLAIGGVLITTGEYLERLLYFKSVVYDRMPGTLG